MKQNSVAGTGVPYVALLVIILAAPFERLAPISSFAGLQLTNVEFVVWLALFLGGTTLVVGLGWRIFDVPLILPAGSLLVLMMISTAFTSEHFGNSIRFTGRFATGLLLFVLTHHSVNSRKKIGGVFGAATLVAGIVALIALGESMHWRPVLGWLEGFRLQSFWATNQPRVAATLGYPTISSMYLEMVFGLALGLLFLDRNRRGRIRFAAVFAVLAMLAYGVILTLTRSGIAIIMALPPLTALFWSWRMGGKKRALTAAALSIATICLLGIHAFRYPQLLLRLQVQDPALWYQARYDVPDAMEMAAGRLHSAKAVVRNVGSAAWQSDEGAIFALSYHWLDADSRETIDFEGLRTPFAQTVHPGERVEMTVRIQAPEEPGQYLLVWDVVQENRLWFGYSGSKVATSFVDVYQAREFLGSDRRLDPKGSNRGPTLAELEAPGDLIFSPSRTELWQLVGKVLAAHPILGVGPDNFRLVYGSYAGVKEWDERIHSNNLYLEILATLGLAGGVLFIWWFLSLAKVVVGTWREVRNEGDGALYLGVTASLSAFFVHGLLDYFLEFTSIYIMFWIVIGLATAGSRLFGEERSADD